jgi:hypothetical protein
MKYILLPIILLSISTSLLAQTAEDSVKSVVNQLFTGMKNADAALFKNVFADSAIMQTVSRSKEGKIIVKTEDLKDFTDFVGKQTKGDADERISFGTIKIDGPLAIVWTPYKFYYKGEFSHCGVNSFHLVRFDGTWKIQYLIDTRRRQACD